MISTYARTLSNFVSTTLKLNKLYCHSGHESEVKLLIHARELMQTYLNYFVHLIPNKYAGTLFCLFKWTPTIVLYFIHLSFSQWWKQFLVWVVVFRCHKGRKWKIWQPRVAVRPREDVNVHFQPECGRKTATSTKNCFCHWENDKCNGVQVLWCISRKPALPYS